MKFIKRKYNQFLVKFLKKLYCNDISISKAKYYCYNNRKLNLEKPTEFMEKIQWLKLYKYTQNYGYYVDKYAVRDYVIEKIGKSFLNECIGIYDSVETINFNILPNQFVLKGTHGSGYNIVVKDKATLNIAKTKKQLNKFLFENYYGENRELIYKDVTPRIIIEKYISEVDCDSLIDYKFYCFHGLPKYVLVKVTYQGKDKKCFYDLDWNKIIPEKIPLDFLDFSVEKPANLEDMITVATKLADTFVFVRVDMYSIKNQITFGELTFFPTGGNKRLSVEKFNKEFGDLIQLPK